MPKEARVCLQLRNRINGERMNSIVTSGELYEFSSNCFEYLHALGFQKSVRADRTLFKSRLFTLILAKDRHGEPPAQLLLSADENIELISPYTALEYFLDNYLNDWMEIDRGCSIDNELERSTLVGALLLKKNSWLFLSDEWTRNKKFLEAVQNTKDWFTEKLGEGDMPTHEESIRHLRSQK